MDHETTKSLARLPLKLTALEVTGKGKEFRYSYEISYSFVLEMLVKARLYRLHKIYQSEKPINMGEQVKGELIFILTRFVHRLLIKPIPEYLTSSRQESKHLTHNSPTHLLKHILAISPHPEEQAIQQFSERSPSDKEEDIGRFQIELKMQILNVSSIYYQKLIGYNSYELLSIILSIYSLDSTAVTNLSLSDKTNLNNLQMSSDLYMLVIVCQTMTGIG